MQTGKIRAWSSITVVAHSKGGQCIRTVERLAAKSEPKIKIKLPLATVRFKYFNVEF